MKQNKILHTHNKKNQTGFTVIELITVLAIMAIIGTLVLNFIVMGYKATRFESEQAEAVKQARDGISIMKKEIRGANSSEQGAYAISIIDNDNFEFYADVDSDDIYEKVKYYLDGTDLKKLTTKPGPLEDYNVPSSTSTIASYMNNQSEDIFTYYDSDHNTTPNINEVRLINIKLKINVTPEIAPADIYIETDVALRNIKSNL